jgi:hypothetical protein
VRFLFSAGSAGCLALAATADAQDAEKTYTLFMGENISVMQAGVLRPVRDVSGGSWVVGVNGQPVLVSSKDGPINMKMVPSLKLTNVFATISKLKSDRAYTFANDPSVRLTRSLNQSANINAGNHAAANQAIAAQMNAVGSLGTGYNSAPANSGAGSAAHSAAIQSTLNSAQSAADSVSNSAGSDLFFREANKESGDFDALDVSFDISAGRPLSEPFIVVITRFHEGDAAAGTSRNLVYAKALDPIDAKATTVKFEQAGFPPGYLLQGVDIHLYNHGNEVATNVAPKRVSYTADEAFEYVKTTYIGIHAGETLPAVPVMIGKLPPDLAERLAAGKYAEKFFVRVSKDGLANESFVDDACSKKIEDPYLESIVRSVRFEPALAQGKPVEGTAPLNLTQLRM